MLSIPSAEAGALLEHVQGLCGPSCEDVANTYFMPCMWVAVAHLDAVCAGTFAAAPPAPSDPVSPDPGLPAPDLFACDEHAVCMACAGGGCEDVLAHYGGPSAGAVDPWADSDEAMALAALVALGRDLPYWCGQRGVPLAGVGHAR